MHFSATILLPLTLLIASTTSAPTTHLERRGLPGAVYICTDQNFAGDCAWQMPSSQCRIPGTGNFAPESIGPDPGGFCILYSTAVCTSQIKTIRFPGISAGLPDFGGLRCFADGDRSESRKVSANIGGVAAASELAGGVGSTTRKEVESQLKKMEEDGFKQGFIGQKKGLYY
ncbi:hypothetical protein K505DRAFT_30785 [Melanomma pulvis-pyrius CBS 109.77]|uniref:Uncharacterized protein n=1 Tax=Melanomma pulvis-pyrius CBS 109.77 TaxID=1314802 RepID=A0A6A6XEJ0_9PLEO|nr:hypothetical protein K505DRAFT_30785 [Melanomma pulvis-pyrius CBS 109.77]